MRISRALGIAYILKQPTSLFRRNKKFQAFLREALCIATSLCMPCILCAWLCTEKSSHGVENCAALVEIWCTKPKASLALE